jgi:hypothetical protein
VAFQRNHVVSSCYLAQWAGDDGRLQAVSARTAKSDAKRPENAGFRKNFWGRNPAVRRHAEEFVSKIESDAAPVLQRLSDAWPLEPGSRGWIGLTHLIALHLWRNPSGQRRFLQLQQESLARKLPEYDADWPPAQIDAFIARVTSDGFRADTMLGDLSKAASVLGSMHWTLVEFNDRLLATSDQPVTIAPLLAPGESAPVAAHPNTPLLHCEEIRIPLGPRHELVLTWQDEPSSEQPVTGTYELATQLNRAAIAQADRHWFHHPARRPTTLTALDLASKECRPVGRTFIPGYGSGAALSSRRRADTAMLLEQMIEDNPVGEIRIVRVRSPAA